jgi:arginyl-tRNA synthetase
LSWHRERKHHPVDGSKTTSRQLKDLARKYLAHLERMLQHKPQEVAALWPEVVAQPYLKMTQAVKFEDGILHVKVSNSALLSLLHEVSERKRLVEALQKKIPEVEIRDISFRIGSFPESIR